MLASVAAEVDEGALTAVANGTTVVVSIIVYVVLAIALWKMFTKAGEAGWKSIIPILNVWVLCKIACGKGWLCFLFIIPFVNIIVDIFVNWKLAKAYGYGVGMCILTVLFPNIGTLIMGFGSHEYIGAQ